MEAGSPIWRGQKGLERGRVRSVLDNGDEPLWESFLENLREEGEGGESESPEVRT